MKGEIWQSGAVYAALILMVLNWLKGWELPWPVILFICLVAVCCMSVEGEREIKHPHHD